MRVTIASPKRSARCASGAFVGSDAACTALPVAANGRSDCATANRTAARSRISPTHFAGNIVSSARPFTNVRLATSGFWAKGAANNAIGCAAKWDSAADAPDATTS